MSSRIVWTAVGPVLERRRTTSEVDTEQYFDAQRRKAMPKSATTRCSLNLRHSQCATLVRCQISGLCAANSCMSTCFKRQAQPATGKAPGQVSLWAHTLEHTRCPQQARLTLSVDR